MRFLAFAIPGLDTAERQEEMDIALGIREAISHLSDPGSPLFLVEDSALDEPVVLVERAIGISFGDVLPASEVDEFKGIRLDQIGEFRQHFLAFGGGSPGPASILEGGSRRGHRPFDIGACAGGNAG